MTAHRFSLVVEGVIVAALLCGLALPRMAGIDKFVTYDEPSWLQFAGNFYYALGQRDFAHTFADYHPAVTTLWTITAAYLWYFPEFRGQGQGYLEKYRNFEQLLARHGKQPLELLRLSRLVNVVINTCLLVTAYLLFRYLLGIYPAVFITLFVALEPYTFGHSRLVSHEGMLSLFILVSVLSATVFLLKSRRYCFLALSAAYAGLALLTKSSGAIAILYIILLMGVVFLREIRSQPDKRAILDGFIKAALFWFFLLVLTFILFWPGMWVAPGKMLYGVFGNALSYALQGARVSAVGEISPQRFSLELTGPWLYLASLLWRTTPVLWAGVGLAIINLFIKGRASEPVFRQLTWIFGLLALLFMAAFSLARGRNSPHYILTSYVCLEVVAALGIWTGLQLLAKFIAPFRSPVVQGLILASILATQAFSLISQYPYYYTYVNPFVQRLFPGAQEPGLGYGEGLDLAAAYLSHKPGAGYIRAASWNGFGPFSYFFPGETVLIPIGELDQATLQKIRESDYLVVYLLAQKRPDIPKDLLKKLDAVSPEHTISLNGVEYVRIYRTRDLFTPEASSGMRRCWC